MSYRSQSSSHGLLDSSRPVLRGRRDSSRRVLRGRWLVWCFLALVCSVASWLPLRADPQVQSGAHAKKTPSKTPRPRYDKTPYLLVLDPLGVRAVSLQGPRMRRPPLAPVRKVSSDTASATPNPREGEGASNEHKSASVLASDPLAPPISLPVTSTASTAPEPPAVERADNALTPPKGQEPELKDAAIYFESPTETHGARATIPEPPEPSSPAQAQPGSSATYRQTK
jgi:hypothetical protein